MVEYAELLQTARRIAQRASQVTDEGDDALLTDKQAESLIPRLNTKIGKKSEGEEYNFMNDMFNRLYSDNQELKKSLQGTVSSGGSGGISFLKNDKAFMDELALMKEKYPGFTEQEYFSFIGRESGGKTDIINSYGYKGLHQMGKAAAKTLGIDYSNIQNQSAVEQLKDFQKYLDFWGYNGTQSLGLLGAAPAFLNASPDTEIYKKGSEAWKANPAWRGKDGRITRRSIEAAYGRTE